MIVIRKQAPTINVQTRLARYSSGIPDDEHDLAIDMMHDLFLESNIRNIRWDELMPSSRKSYPPPPPTPNRH